MSKFAAVLSGVLGTLLKPFGLQAVVSCVSQRCLTFDPLKASGFIVTDEGHHISFVRDFRPGDIYTPSAVLVLALANGISQCSPAMQNLIDDFMKEFCASDGDGETLSKASVSADDAK